MECRRTSSRPQRHHDLGAQFFGQGSEEPLGLVVQPGYAASATNLSHYLALRHHDLRDLQSRLMAAGLSSLGRSESHVLPTLTAIRRILSFACGAEPPASPPPAADFFAGQRLFSARADAILGPCGAESPVCQMITLPSGAATDATFVCTWQSRNRRFGRRLGEVGIMVFLAEATVTSGPASRFRPQKRAAPVPGSCAAFLSV